MGVRHKLGALLVVPDPIVRIRGMRVRIWGNLKAVAGAAAGIGKHLWMGKNKTVEHLRGVGMALPETGANEAPMNV